MNVLVRPCPYCVAGYGLNASDCLFAHEHDVAPLARELAAAIHETEPSDEQVGWTMEDAEAIFTDFKRTPRTWHVTHFERPIDVFDATFRVNGIAYVIEGGENPVRLSTWKRWQREAGDE